MSKKGFDSSALAYIRLIRDNLRDRYDDGYPILKEIIQNADDSGATTFDFGWCPGLPDDEHPLAKSPAVFFVNNGRFTAADERAIKQFGFGYKAAEKGSVGKFGLGLKSMFHWCEAFFYLYSDSEQHDPSSFHGDILNPWSGESPERSKHTDWDDCQQSTLERLHSYIRPQLRGPEFFCLWVPLRRVEDLGGVSPIVESYPISVELDSPHPPPPWGDAEDGIVTLLPLLKNLRTIACWTIETANELPTREFVVELDSASNQRLFPDIAEDSVEQPKRGRVYRRNSTKNAQEEFSYVGSETSLNSVELCELKNSPFWPKDVGMDKDTGEDLSVDEKASPNASVTILSQRCTRGDKGMLQINWAAFLPVGRAEDYALKAPLNVRVILHGDFFLDAGRKHIEGIHEAAPSSVSDEASVRGCWNHTLRREGVLPLLIPVLHNWRNETRASNDEVEALARALQHSPVIYQNKADVTRGHQWVYRVRANEEDWLAVDGNTAIWTIPSPPSSDPRRPFVVFPKLAGICEERVFTFSDKPLIAREKPGPCSIDIIDRLLTDVSVKEIFTKPAYTEYFANFLCAAQLREHHPPESLRRLLRHVFQTISLTELGKCRQHVKRLVAEMPASWFVPISEKVPLHGEMIRCAAASGNCPTLIPATYLDGDRPTVADEDALIRVMQTFATPPEELGSRPEYTESCHQFVISLLKEPIAQTVLDRAALRGLRVFNARKVSENRSLLLTLTEIAATDDDGSLYSKSQNDLVKPLQEALSDAAFYTVDSETYRYATGKQESYPCNSINCIRYIDKYRPRLRNPERRKTLLGALLPALDDNQDEVFRRVCRYLLHGDPAAYESDLDLVASVRGERSDVWGRLYHIVLEFKNARWCYVEPELTDLLNPHHQTRLWLVNADRLKTQRLLVEYKADLPRLDMDSLTERERDIILEEIHETDLLKALPIHRTLSGELTHIDATTFLESNVPTCSYVRERTRIVAKHSSPELAKRQEGIIEVLSAGHVLPIVLKAENSETHWALIAEVLRSAKANELNASIDPLRKTKWIPTRMGGVAVSPSQILWIPGLESDIDRLRFPEDLQYAKYSDVIEELWRHAGMKQHLEKLLPSLEDQLEMLGEVLSEHQDFRLGVQVSDEHHLEEFVKVFHGKTILPVADIIHRLSTKALVQWSQIVQGLLPHLSGALSGEQFVSVLEYLSGESESALGESKGKFLGWHSRYLESVQESGRLFEVLPHIRLKNRAGRWKAATNLCINAPGIRREDILNEEQADLLGLHDSASSDDHPDDLTPGEVANKSQTHLSLSDIDGEVAQSAIVLRDYFRTWADRLPDELIGGFLCFLGDLPEIRAVAEQYLGQRSIEKTREALDWPTMSRLGRGASETLEESMREQRFIIRIVSEGEIAVESIAGTRFIAQQSKDVDTIFIGDTFRAVWRDGLNYRVNYLDLRALDPGAIEQDGKLGEILLTSLEQLFARIYFRQVSGVDALWQELGESEQLDVAIAQDMLLDSLFTIIRQMGVDKGHEELRGVLEKYDRVRKQIAETNAKEKSNKYRDSDAEAKYIVRQELIALLEKNSDVQQAILSALRAKVKDFQYSAASIPFELFQNADDATVELLEMRATSAETSSDGAFVIIASENSIRTIHWGRPINKFREGEFDGRDRGFDNDLEKMLVLSYSDKGNTQGKSKVTGKFGLGFKSAFLITDRPRIKSGRLGFEVVSGFWPRLLSPDEQQELNSPLHQFRPDDRNGTLIELPDLTTPAQEVLSDFRRLSPVLLAFSRAITSIRIEELEMEESYHVAWKPEYLDEVNTLYIGQLELMPNDTPSTVLKVNAGRGALLFKLEPTGFAKMPPEIPSVWVTAPTSESSTLGFVINGPFPLDVGRAQLSRDETSYQSLAHEIGREFLSGMEAIYQIANFDWRRFIEKLNMRPELDPYSFWFSVWELLVEPFADSRPQHENNAIRLMRDVLWGEAEGNLRTFYREKYVIPTGLRDAYRAMTRLEDIETRLKGVLERREVFLCASTWGSATDLLRQGSVISSSVDEALQRLGILKRGCAESLSLIDLLELDTGGSGVITAEKALMYGELINRSFMQCDSLEEEEREGLQELLLTYKFGAMDDTAQSARELVIAHDVESNAGDATETDEQLRAAFAPRNRVLAPAYLGMAVEFFRICRRELRAPVTDLVEWALEAQDESRQNAVLRYILDGGLGRDLGRDLREKKAGTWLEDFHDLVYYKDLVQERKDELDGLLGGSSPKDDALAVPGLPPLDPEEVLNRLYEWWLGARESETQDYERKVYPTGSIELPAPSFQFDDIDHRKSWYSLFILGMTHTLGRSRPEQHRSFLSLCREKHWLDVFSAREIEAERWMKVLDEFIDNPQDSEQFSHWMKLFPSFYRVSKSLDEYIEALLAVEYFESVFDLDDITSVRTSPRFQGGGIDAPKITGTLGIGACFVMRELIRGRTVSQPLAHRHCYVPSGRVRNFFSQLGCIFDNQDGAAASVLIHEFIVRFLGEEKATFQLSFDLPFISLLDSRSRQLEILGREIASDSHHVSVWGGSNCEDGDFVTLADGRRIPRERMN